MMENRVRVQCSGKSDLELMVARCRDAEERWPDQEFDGSVGRQLRDRMEFASSHFDRIEFAWPANGLVPGNDYIDMIGHVLARAEVDRPVRVIVGRDQTATEIASSRSLSATRARWGSAAPSPA